MARPERLDDSAIAERLKALDGWSVVDGKLRRELKFEDFRDAFGFMTQMALYAEKRDHHPEWFNVYNTLRIELRTHDADGLTALDFEFAEEVDRRASAG